MYISVLFAWMSVSHLSDWSSRKPEKCIDPRA